MLQQQIAKKILSGIEDLDTALLRERVTLAKNRIKVEYGTLSHTTPFKTWGSVPNIVSGVVTGALGGGGKN